MSYHFTLSWEERCYERYLEGEFCTRCSGSGEVECGECWGSGCCSDGGQCENCGGSGRVPCPECGGY